MSTIRSNTIVFVVFTVIMMALYTMPQTVCFIRNDMMGIFCTVYYMVFIHRDIPISVALKVISPILLYAIVYGTVSMGFDFKLGIILPIMTTWTFSMPAFAMVAIYRRNSQIEQKAILVSTIVCLLYVCINTFLAIQSSPDIMRNLDGNSDMAFVTSMRMSGIGGFGFAYTMGLLFVALFALHNYRIAISKNPLVYWAILFAIGYFVLCTQFTTLLFIIIFSIFFYYFLDSRTIIKKLKFIILLFLAYYFFQSFILLGISLFEGQTLGIKFQMIYDGIWVNNDLEHVSAERSEWQLDAFRLFLSSPIWGNYILKGNAAIAFDRAHSTILSIMCSTGLLGLFSYFSTYIRIAKYQANNLFDKKERTLYFSCIAYYFFFSFFNPTDNVFELSWTLFITVPLLSLYFTRKFNQLVNNN